MQHLSVINLLFLRQLLPSFPYMMDLIFHRQIFILVFTSISLFCFIFCCYDKMPTKNTLVRKGLVATSRLQLKCFKPSILRFPKDVQLNFHTLQTDTSITPKTLDHSLMTLKQ